MGSSESKMVVCAPIKPEPAIKNSRVSDLMDPRSPTALDRTPIQVAVSKTECPLAFTDPRSPSIDISRTPAREVLSSTVGSFARRLGLLLHTESEGKVPEAPPKCFNDAVEEEEESFKGEEELSSTVPLLSHQPSHTYDSLAEHANLLVTPLQSKCDLSPFVLLQNPQEVDVELETETDLSLEEAEEARETPLHKRLSMSLITYHEGETSAQIFADVHCDGASSPRMSADVETLEDHVDHTYDLPTITVEPETPVEPSFAADSEASPAEETETKAQETEETETRAQETEEADIKAQDTEETETKAQETEETETRAQDTEETETKAQETEETETKAEETETKAQETEETETKAQDTEEADIKAPVEESSSSSPAPEPPTVSRSGIRCPSFDAKSPSQVVFKPQWLGKGFGATGIRARRVHSGKGGSSPLAVRVAVKNANSENKRLSGKLKQTGTEGRSPLQRLKGTNSPREQQSQMKLKVSTPDKPRLGAMDRRALAVSLDKENR
ncbi:hypothetical protein OYC64_014296 [Pagothenia borchgrevinki]|uniref:Cell division cycle-associated protein 3 n=1 Tax=Pagothenia borchgrevinki TaxID=8213 RepID=A0ABD2H001_PAGBO